MGYFQELPNISYSSLLPSRNRVESRVTVKNLFKRSKLRTDLDQAITAFNYYNIKDGMRPDMVAQELYDNPELDWVVLTSSNITNIRKPLTCDSNPVLRSLMAPGKQGPADFFKIQLFEGNPLFKISAKMNEFYGSSFPKQQFFLDPDPDRSSDP